MSTVLRERLAKTKEDLHRLKEIEKCSAGTAEACIYWIENYQRVYETREGLAGDQGPGWSPFKLWTKQKLYIHAMFNALNGGYALAVVKCRDMGGTTVSIEVFTYWWRFRKNFHGLLGSRKVDLVKLSPGHNTLFAKVRDCLESMPDWMLPSGYDPDQHLRSLSLLNPEGGNTLIGEHCTPNFGVGSRATAALVDEYAKWEDEIHGTLIYTTPVAFYVSTVEGMNHFFDFYTIMEPLGRKFQFHWYEAPHHTKEWFEEARRTTPKAKFNREVLCDPRASVEGQVYPIINERIIASESLPEPPQFRSDFDTFMFWDYGLADETYLGVVQRDPETEELFLLSEIHSNGKAIEWYVPFVPNKIVPNSTDVYEPEHLAIIERHRLYKGTVTHYGDPTGSQRSVVTGESVFSKLKQYGIEIKCGPGWQDMIKRQQAAIKTLDRLYIHLDNCKYFVDSFSQYRIKAQPNAITGNIRGIHRWSHAPSAWEAFALSIKPSTRNLPPPSNTMKYDNPWKIKRK